MFAKLEDCSRGRAGATADMGMVGQDPVFDRVAVHDGLYDFYRDQFNRGPWTNAVQGPKYLNYL